MIPVSSIQLSSCQETALEVLTGTRENIFLTGGPGTGKSFLLSYFLREQPEKIPVVASTGAAAILVGGRTFHSFFGLGILQGGPEAVLRKARKNSRLKKRIRECETLVIDEISMLSREALDCAESVARDIRKASLPWGGIRIIAVGDFAQLPPISRGRIKSWCFLSGAWQKSNFRHVELKKVQRTRDRLFLEILEDIRWGRVTDRVTAFLAGRLREAKETETDIPHLFPRRAQTDAFNRARLAELKRPSRKFETEYGGADVYVQRLMKDAPVPPVLELKEGALVMIRVNDPKQRYVNGTVGRIAEIHDDYLVIETHKRYLEVPPFTFTVLDEDGEEAAYAINFPVHLAYATTIHKVQGTTLEKAHMDLRALWEPGQAYVALSRGCHRDSVSLLGWEPSSIKADPCVHAFYTGTLQDLPFEDLHETIEEELF